MADQRRKLAIDLFLTDGMSAKLADIRKGLGKLKADAKDAATVLTYPFVAPLRAIGTLVSKVLNLRNLFAGFLAFRIAQAGLRELNQLTGELDKVAKLSDRLGVTAESLQAVDYAAKLSGTSLQELTPGLVTFERQLELAKRGNLEAGLSLRTLGVDINAVREGQIDLVDVLAQVADAYTKVGSRTSQVSALTTAFGEAGAKLGPLLKGGAEGVRAIAREAQQRGLIFTRDELARAEAYQDALLRVSTAFKSTFQHAFLDAAPAVATFFNRVATFIDENRGKVVALFKEAAGLAGSLFSIMLDGAIALVSVLENIPGVVQVPDAVRKEYFDLAAQLMAIDQLARQGGFAKSRANADAQPGFTKGLFPDASKITELGRTFTIEFVDAITPNKAAIQKRFDELAAQMPGQLAASMRKAKASLLSEIQKALDGTPATGTQVDTFRNLLEQAGIRTDDDVVRAVGAGLISPEALLEGVQRGLFSSGVVEKITALVRGQVAKAVTTADPQALQAQAVALRDLSALERSLLELKQPTLDVKLALEAVQDQATRADLAQKLIPALVDGKITGEQLAQAMDDLATRTQRAMDAIKRGAEQDAISFKQQLASIEPTSRKVRAELARLEGRARELSFEQAAADGKISLEQLREAIAKVREETERAARLAEGDFGEGFRKGSREALDAWTDLSRFGEEAGRSLVDRGLGGLSDALGTFITDVGKGKEAFRDFAADMLRLLGQIIAKWLILKGLQAIGIAFEHGGIMPGELVGTRRLPMHKYALGGIAPANQPQLAVFGEGKRAEAFVPLPDGRSIPVTLTGGGGGGGLTLIVQTVDAKDTSRWFYENRGLLWGLQSHGVEHSAALRTATRRASR